MNIEIHIQDHTRNAETNLRSSKGEVTYSNGLYLNLSATHSDGVDGFLIDWQLQRYDDGDDGTTDLVNDEENERTNDLEVVMEQYWHTLRSFGIVRLRRHSPLLTIIIFYVLLFFVSETVSLRTHFCPIFCEFLFVNSVDLNHSLPPAPVLTILKHVQKVLLIRPLIYLKLRSQVYRVVSGSRMLMIRCRCCGY